MNVRCRHASQGAVLALFVSAVGHAWADEIGFVGFDANTSFLSTFASEVQEAGKAAGYTVRVAQSDSDATKQANQVNILISSGVKGLLVDPVNAQAIVPVIKRAVSQGVPVIPVDGSAAAGPIPVQVATDNYGAGTMACQVIGKALNGKGTVLNLQGALDNFAAQGRTAGFTDCMKKSYPGITVVSKPFNWSSEVCAQVAQTQMSTSKIDGVYAAAAQCLTPVLTVLRTQNRLKKVNEPGHVPFVTVDGTPDELKAVREGYLSASISQPLSDIAKYGVGYLKRTLGGEKIKAGPTDHGTNIVEVNGTLRDLLPPVVVTQANADSPTLWASKK
jgi:simple sugar transport system substrate-binding protein/ribose transport system substrate-binding protein